MTAEPEDKHKRLREHGLVRKDELPPEYQAVIDGLTPHELEVILAVKRRLDEADRVAGTSADKSGLPGFTNFLVF